MTTRATVRETALSIRGMGVTRGRREVLELDALDVGVGEVVAVLGPNGAGKSSLLLAAAMLIPAAGELRIFGELASQRNHVQLRRATATVFQDAALLDMSARANVETALRLHGVPRADRRRIADEWLERLAVADRADARAHQLSGGEAQRVSLARAFAVQPRLLFLDEPFAALDANTRSSLLGDVRALLRGEQTSALLTTHDRAEAELLADRVVVILDGRIAQQGPTAEVFARPATEDVARFFGYSIVSGAVAARLAGLQAAPAPRVAVPPADVRLTATGIEGPVTEVRGAPAGAEVVVDVGEPVALWLSVDDLRERGIEVGSRLTIAVNEGHLAPL